MESKAVENSPEAGDMERARAVARRFKRRIALAVFCVAALLGLAVFLSNAPFLRFTHLEIYGDAPKYAVAPITAAVRSSLRGNYLTADLAEVRKRVEKLEGVQSASVYRIWPGTLAVVVKCKDGVVPAKPKK